jgi:peptidoglycan/LPS O-acetylase OafA/YrhL
VRALLWKNIQFRETVRYTIQGIALVPLFYAAIKYHRYPLFRVLNNKVLVFIGKISYGFYLSHYLLIYLAQDLWGESMFSKIAGGLTLTLLFSSMLYFFVEKYFYNLRKKLHS